MCGRFYIAPEAHLQQSVAHLQLKLFQDLPIKFSGEIFPTDIAPVFIINPAIKCIYIMMMFSVIMMGWKREILAEYHWKFWRRKGDTQLP